MEDIAGKYVMTLSEVAKYLRVTEKTVLRLVHGGTIPAAKVGNQWRFFKSVVDEWMYANMDNRAPAVTPDGKRPLGELLDPGYVLLDIRPGDKERVLEQLITPLVDNGIIRAVHRVLEKVLFREAINSTAVGNGVAFPHMRNPKENPAGAPPIIAGGCREGTDFGSLASKPVHLFFLLCATQESVHLNVMSRLSLLLMSKEFRASLIRSKSPVQFVQLIQERESKA